MKVLKEPQAELEDLEIDEIALVRKGFEPVHPEARIKVVKAHNPLALALKGLIDAVRPTPAVETEQSVESAVPIEKALSVTLSSDDYARLTQLITQADAATDEIMEILGVPDNDDDEDDDSSSEFSYSEGSLGQALQGMNILKANAGAAVRKEARGHVKNTTIEANQFIALLKRAEAGEKITVNEIINTLSIAKAEEEAPDTTTDIDPTSTQAHADVAHGEVPVGEATPATPEVTTEAEKPAEVTAESTTEPVVATASTEQGDLTLSIAKAMAIAMTPLTEQMASLNGFIQSITAENALLRTRVEEVASTVATDSVKEESIQKAAAKVVEEAVKQGELAALAEAANNPTAPLTPITRTAITKAESPNVDGLKFSTAIKTLLNAS